MADFTTSIDLADARLGGVVLAANDEFFAPKENLLNPAPPIALPERYTDRGKWMDGWETRRRRRPGHDWCLIRLGLAGVIRGIVVDTSFFRGNFPSHCSMEACAAEPSAPIETLTSQSTRWFEVLPGSPLDGDAQNRFAIADPRRVTHLRFNIFPDGGVARLRVHGEVLPDWRALLSEADEHDLAAVTCGGRAIEASDMFFGRPQSLLVPHVQATMGDGWETRRRRGPGHDWVVIQLGIEGEIRRVEVDTTHFKGNYPESCSLDACSVAEGRPSGEHGEWTALLPRMPLGPDARHVFERELVGVGPATHVRLNIFPDGGVSRLRIHGVPTRRGRREGGVRWLDALDPEAARPELASCCGSPVWLDHMVAARPFRTAARLFETADGIWRALPPEEWVEAFRHHPRIGESQAVRLQPALARRWSEQEQSGVRGVPAATLAALTEANRIYEDRFGHRFIVCASGRSGEEILAALRDRLAHDPETELRVAADEERQITRLRLEKLIGL